jgi:VanZ family protein
MITVPSGLEPVASKDKLLHFTEFLAFSLILFNVLQVFKVKKIYVSGLMTCVVFIVLSEVVQMFVPNRTFSYLDMLADFAGVIVGTAVFTWIFYRKSK